MYRGKPAFLVGALVASSFVGPGIAHAAGNEECRRVQPKPERGFGCVRDGGGHYRVRTKDTATNFREVYTKWVMENGKSHKLYDGSWNGQTEWNGNGNVKKFRVCQSHPDGGERNDACSDWEKT